MRTFIFLRVTWNTCPSLAYYLIRGCNLMVKFLLWCILFVLCWPIALVALLIFPFVWIILLPFKIVGVAVGGVLHLVWALVTLPARVLRAVV